MHQSLITRALCALATAAVLTTSPLSAATQTSTPQTPADNTKVNTRDREKGAVTADQQKENAADRTTTQNVRKALLKDKSLSTYAHNVKVVTMDGKVTLKGPVRSEAEKKTVEEAAIKVAGAGNVINEMSIAAAKPAKQ